MSPNVWAEERREKICRRCFLTPPFKSLNISTLRKYFHSIYLRFLHFSPYFSLYLSISLCLSLSNSLSLCLSLPLCLSLVTIKHLNLFFFISYFLQMEKSYFTICILPWLSYPFSFFSLYFSLSQFFSIFLSSVFFRLFNKHVQLFLLYHNLHKFKNQYNNIILLSILLSLFSLSF